MSLRSEAVGVAFRKEGDAGAVRRLNEAFGEMRKDGTMEKIVEKYGLDVEKNVYGGAENDQTETAKEQSE